MACKRPNPKSEREGARNVLGSKSTNIQGQGHSGQKQQLVPRYRRSSKGYRGLTNLDRLVDDFMRMSI